MDRHRPSVRLGRAASQDRSGSGPYRAGAGAERRAFLPNITLARFGRDAGDVGATLTRGTGDGMAFEARDFCLYESERGHEGASYAIVERYPLG